MLSCRARLLSPSVLLNLACRMTWHTSRMHRNAPTPLIIVQFISILRLTSRVGGSRAGSWSSSGYRIGWWSSCCRANRARWSCFRTGSAWRSSHSAVAGLHGPERVAGHLSHGGLRGNRHGDAGGGEKYCFHGSVSKSGKSALDVTELALFRHWVRRLRAKNLLGEAFSDRSSDFAWALAPPSARPYIHGHAVASVCGPIAPPSAAGWFCRTLSAYPRRLPARRAGLAA
jgi:hypothetical protein